ncbi:efflux RND transporter periplasmic adaptor subunit [Paenibacillus radicis (ex Xue et al. 2023)]|uniref:Efflux RND transporter periplasmic adaptor subunit n=1 Tax=Paenibacillus radicis (ex Xue et al. 2023) TaxID=2972489 RepID=A0ABT1YER4_9BACL|nr:efflux RND transporter periplasmic adaptor subunit [Paenibacillus radicis (ex Xue et al. 2023)]MCR8631656.1 efflux RND transporter periplasmic adaptor subunit [Paenibacillus radicis (ex Xue et al. 2023)]
MKPENANKVHKGAKIMGAIVLSTALIAGCSSAPKAQPAQADEVQLKQVKVNKIEKKKISEPLEQVADIASSIQLDVPVKVGGDVQEILKKRGDMVEKGEVIFRLDPTDVLISKEKAQISISGTGQQLAKAREDLVNSKLDLQNGIIKLESSIKEADKNYSKMRNDYDLGLVTKFQLEQTETQLNNQRLDLASNQQKLKTLETTNSLSQLEQGLQTSEVSIREADRTLEHMEVKASVSGVLTDLPLEVGMTLAAGFRAAQIQQLDPIKIKAELTEEAAKLVRGKQELSFYISGSTEKLKGKVSYLADVVSAQSKSYSLELEVPNADRKLRPGMKAQVLLTEDQDQIVVTVPTLSVVREGGETFVFILTGDTVEKRKVELGRLNETYQEVLKGVKEGEQLVTSGQHQLKDKEKVQLAQ